MKHVYQFLISLGSRIMLLLGESIVLIERRTKRGLQIYLIIGASVVILSWTLAYLVFSWEDIRIDKTSIAQEIEAPPIPVPPRYLFLNDYYFFEEALDLEAGSDLILTPEHNLKLDKEKLKADFLQRELFVKDKQIIDNELSRLVR